MKLELKHLAPYLPYELKFTDSVSKTIWTLMPANIAVFNYAFHKPILYPLSDLTKEIECNGEKFVPVEKLNELIGCEFGINSGILWITDKSSIGFSEEFIPFYEKLFEWHFDVFNLIGAGLAISKEDATLKQS